MTGVGFTQTVATTTSGTHLHGPPVGLRTGLPSLSQPSPTPAWTIWVPEGCPNTGTAIVHTTPASQGPKNSFGCLAHHCYSWQLSKPLCCLIIGLSGPANANASIHHPDTQRQACTWLPPLGSHGPPGILVPSNFTTASTNKQPTLSHQVTHRHRMMLFTTKEIIQRLHYKVHPESKPTCSTLPTP